MKTATITLQSLIVAVAALLSNAASAQVHPEKPDYPYEKCYGIVKAGFNDCFTASNSCAGTVEKDNAREAWIYVPKGTCQRTTGGTTVAPN